ncbi:cupin domain-containing protein [Pseudonocardia endophytica]|uniref:Cupin domain n=1 Tax=Pseudonocardia endophytica TaxID=401976 RepID=A0A4R1HJK7_PSEEN|nr:cupin domain-containing protein [Pseudonocardia endophytica]TCK21171.1 cupin domain [Pseudonocardia endophytica]
MTVIRHADARCTSTPNATMTTLASPTQGGTDQALWRVEMTPGAVGPLHAMDGEQVWTVLDGAAHVDVGDATEELSAGDTLVLPAGVLRRIHADPDAGMTAVVTGRGGSVASGPDRDPVVPAWIS